MEDKDQKVFEAPASEKNQEGEAGTKNSDQSSLPEAQSTIQPSATAELEGAAPVRSLKGIAWIICVGSIFSSVFLYALDNTIVATIQPAIIGDLGHLEKLPWLAVAFQLTSFALDLTWGKLYAQFNGKSMFLASVFIFEVGSAVCGAAPTIDALIFGRAICGAGGIGIYIGALNLLAVTTTDKERPVYISCMGIVWGTGTVLGPVVGGAFADSSATWRWAFYINLVIGAVAAPAYIFLLPSTNPNRREVKLLNRIRTIDWVGTVLICGAAISGIMAVNFGGALFAWNSGQIIGCFVCSGVLWILFGLQQSFSVFTTPEHRLLPCDIILHWEADILFAQTASGMGSSVVAIYFIPLYFQFVQNDTALHAGIRLLPMIFLMIFGSILNGTMLSKYGHFMPWAFGGGILVVIGAALMYALVEVDTNAAPIYGYSILLAFGAGLFTQGPISVVQAKFPANRVADATAFVGFGQIAGIAIMLSVANAVFLNSATNGIIRLLPDTPVPQVQAAIAGVGSELFRNLSDTLRRGVLEVIVHSINDAYILIMVAGALTVVLSGSGIGRETALAFSTAGASKIVLLGRTEASLKETASYLPSGISSSVHAIDIAEEKARQDVAATVGKWDILILAAGHIPTPGPIVEASSNEWWQSFETNVKGTMLAIKAFVPTANPSHATVLGVTTGTVALPPAMLPGLSAYMSSKLAQEKLIEFFALEQPNMFAATVHPGMVETAVFTKSGAKAEALPMEKVQLPAHFILWMSSSEAAFLKGRSVWANWDVDELKSQAQAIQSGLQMTSGIYGWPYPHVG